MNLRAIFSIATLAGASALLGCHSAYIQADVKNGTGAPVSVLEVDYPSASFGTQSLAAGATFRYRFKILGEGPLKVSWTDAAGHDHTSTGPGVSEGQEGALTVTLGPRTAGWDLRLQR